MNSCPWERIADFDGWSEFNRFNVWLHSQVAEGVAKETAILKPYSEAGGLTEKWFVHMPTNQVWRLVWPEPPFAGIFEPVS